MSARAKASGDRLRASVPHRSCGSLHLVLGDQLHIETSALDGFDPRTDVVLMAELDHEATWTPSHRQRIAVFFSAMRHFAARLVDRGWTVRYVRVNDPHNTHRFAGELDRAARMLTPNRVVVTEPGEWRVLHELRAWSNDSGVPLDVEPDRHFLTSTDEFGEWLDGRKQPIMEHFYRWQRRRLAILIEADGSPTGGVWNLDKDNREAFDSRPHAPVPDRTEPDPTTLEVIELVNRRYPGAPGRLDPGSFAWPVTVEDAERHLRSFVDDRLEHFGRFEDAMWTGEPFLYHSMLSVPMNLKLLSPARCVAAAIDAHAQGRAPLNSVEGFVRQIIGWREFIRGIYWTEGAGYRDRNALDQHGRLPDLYWTGETDMRCMRECLESVLDHAWCHHIPRLMILSSFALMAGVRPRALGDWFYAMYADSVDWVTTPNTIGMAMHADGDDHRSSVVGTKPYAGSGKYIGRMSNFCDHCPYDNRIRHGRSERGQACPFNTMYWDFLIRQHSRFSTNNRMAMILKHVDRMDRRERAEIAAHADRIRHRLGIGSPDQDALRSDAMS